MAKVALLIGVSDYQISGSEKGFTDIPSARLDVEGMKRILEKPELGAFDHVKTLVNPAHHEMSEIIETFLSDRQKDDLVLLYFSGHGAKDGRRKLYFAAKGTKKNARDELLTATAVPADFVRDRLTDCKATKKIMILDCCFSGAIDPNAKGDDTLEVLERELSTAKGTIILTSSSSVQLSHGHPSEMSFYTRHLVNGIESGEADRDNVDGYVSIKELHNYVSAKLQEEKINMTPKKFLPVEEGLFEVPLIKVPITNPKQVYRQKVEAYIKDGHAENGEFDFIILKTLKKYQTKLNKLSKVEFSSTDAQAIQDELLQPIKQHFEHLEEYKEAFYEAVEKQSLTDKTRKSLNRFQESLELSDEEVASIEKEVNAQFTHLAEAYRQKLTQYEKVFIEAIQQDYPFSQNARNQLTQLWQSLGLSDEDVVKIESSILAQEDAKYQDNKRKQEQAEEVELEQKRQKAEREEKLRRYEQELARAFQAEYPLSQYVLEELKNFQQELGLKDEDVARIERWISEPAKTKYQDKLRQEKEAEQKQSTNLNYDRLRGLLEANNWQEADKETFTLMLKLANRGELTFFDPGDIDKLSCEDIRKINQLWTDNSNRKFGFSVQRIIYQRQGEDFTKFAEKVGWKRQKWLSYRERLAINNPPNGHFPSSWLLQSTLRAKKASFRGEWRLYHFSRIVQKVSDCSVNE